MNKHKTEREITLDVSPFMAAYFLGYVKSQKGEKIASEDVEKLLMGVCLSMGINPIEDITDLFNALFGSVKEENEEPLSFYS
ncbi:hypothetical protein [uncultured Methanobrevibacter sp.]|uniref:hypothetical protein n=1 Tax=uncultured Methanobrevibacter sp. TaxID=253161 RepID=UPI00260FE2E9